MMALEKIVNYIDHINKDSVTSFVKAYLTKYSDILGINKLKDHEKFQLAIRSELCKDCVESKKCVNSSCKCKVPDLFFDKTRIDALDKWGVMMDENQFNEFLSTIDSTKVEDIEHVAYKYSEYYKAIRDQNLTKLQVNNVLTFMSLDPTTTMVMLGDIEGNSYYQLDDTVEKKLKTYDIKFTLINTSNRSISISSLELSCSCFTASYSTDIILANQDYTIDIVYTPIREGLFEGTIGVKLNPNTVIHPSLSFFANVRNKE